MSHFNSFTDSLHKGCDKESLKKSFKKNGLDYKLIDRTERVALFELIIDTANGTSSVCGYEVCKIHIMRACVLNGREYPEAEVTPSNEEFGYDGSKSFFPHDLERVKEFFREFTLQLQKSHVEV